MARPPPTLFCLLASVVTLVLLVDPSAVAGSEWGGIQNAPSESECRPYIEKALKEFGSSDSQEDTETLKRVEDTSYGGDPKEDDEERLEHEVEQSDSSRELNGEETSIKILQDSGEEEENETSQEFEEHEKNSTIEESEGPLIDYTGHSGEETSVEVTTGTDEETETNDQQNLNKISTHVEEGIDIECVQEVPESQKADSNNIERVYQKSNEDDTDSNETNLENSSGQTEDEIIPNHQNEEINKIPSGNNDSTEDEEKEELQNKDVKEPDIVFHNNEPNTESKETDAVHDRNSDEEFSNLDHENKETFSEEQSPEVITETNDSDLNEEKGHGHSNEETVDKKLQEENKSMTETLSEDNINSDVIVSAESTSDDESVENGELLEERVIAEDGSINESETADEKEAAIEEITHSEIDELKTSEELDLKTKAEENKLVNEDSSAKQDKLSNNLQNLEETGSNDEQMPQGEENNNNEKYIENEEKSSERPSDEEITLDKKTPIQGKINLKKEESSAEEEEIKEEEMVEEVPQEAEPEEEDLTMSSEIPDKLRLRDHISEILKLDDASVETDNLLKKTIDGTLKELKKLYESAIKPLEILYKYRDLSNRHFGDSEIFSKPLILFMGPWSGGKSTIINYLLNNEYKKTALRTGAEPSPAYFNIVMWGVREEVLDGTQLAADWTFSGLQKFGQGLLDRLKGHKLNHPLLEKVNVVEIPGILEIRKQVERLFPFNDACQWFIDRADIIFLVYDPSKLDVGPETEAILDQLKGREYQTRIILNKADQVKPEELMRVQGTLIWNISPLMSSTEPPVMYSTSLWSVPYQSGSPTRLLYAQEKAFLRDLKEAVDRRVENKIASARRFAVRVRNHAKMVDCYLTTYYNHKTFFGNKKKVSDDIIEHPQNYHIYEGLSTLTNISRYDLPDPDVYRDFFRLNAVYDFQQLSSTCTYFRGCPINRLDVAIAYDLPELIGKYKKAAEDVSEAANKKVDNS